MAIDDTVVTAGHVSTATDRPLRGCPVMHEDFSRMRAVGSHWEWADELREASPVYFNTFAQGYWVFTRHDAVRDIYKTPEIFSSESFTPWEPNPIYRFVPTQIDAPDHIKYRRILNPWFSPRAMDEAEPMMRLCRKLVETTAPAGQCNFVNGFALRYPTEACRIAAWASILRGERCRSPWRSGCVSFRSSGSPAISNGSLSVAGVR